MVSDQQVVLVPLEGGCTIVPGADVIAERTRTPLLAGNGFQGRVVDGLGRPIDSLGPVTNTAAFNEAEHAVAALDRLSPTKTLPTGVAAIDAMLTLGMGQRIGIFSASGGGKTSLIQQMARQIDCDHVILCLIGERGREVESFWREHLAASHGARTTIVAATSDAPAPMRVRALNQALALAEFWRSSGHHTVLIVDSVTRYAMALRELGLAAGEPPTLRGYTPNVLVALPKVVERCGCRRAGGAITGLFTVLSETDDVDDPIVEVMKSLLDGHIILSRTLAQLGQFPPIDVSRSISRLASSLVDKEHRKNAGAVLRSLARYDEARMLIESGLYVAGSELEIDDAIALRPHILDFLAQGTEDDRPMADTVRLLASLASRTRNG
jgi:flagellum-specific ATP synthase